MAIIEFSIVPVGTGSPSVSMYIARAVKVLENETGLKYATTPMGTIVEGELGRLLSLIPKIHQALFDSGVQRIVTNIKIDDRRDKPSTMESKLASLKRELQGLGVKLITPHLFACGAKDKEW